MMKGTAASTCGRTRRTTTDPADPPAAEGDVAALIPILRVLTQRELQAVRAALLTRVADRFVCRARCR